MAYEPQAPTGYQKFLKSKAAPYVGMLIVAVFGLVFLYMGIYSIMCGSFILGVLLYMLPKAMNANWKQMAVFGVIFFVVASAFGTFVITKPYIEDLDGKHNSGDFKNVYVDPYMDSDTYTVYVEYDAFPIEAVSGSEELQIRYGKTGDIYMKSVLAGKLGEWQTMTGSGTTYTYLLDDLSGDSVYYFELRAIYDTSTETGLKKTSGDFIGPVTATDSELTMKCLYGNLYFVGLYVMLIFFLILIFTTWMRSNLEKTRARLEAEGRLYPQGYGRCKTCGTMVLPGEVVCRKCGEYIDVPEEFKPKKVDYFTCSECGKEVPADAEVCPACGEHFDEEETEIFDAESKSEGEFVCSECGSEVPGDARTCPSCGKEFED